MTQKKFDIAILGSDLGARIAATLLAKGGKRVILFTDRETAPAAPLLSSLHFERLLGHLGARSCFRPPRPFQLITDRSRIEFHGPLSLAEEMTREFPKEHGRLLPLLEKLRESGEELEEAMLESSLPLFGAASRLRFFRRRLAHRLPMRHLCKPLTDHLKNAGIQEAIAPITALFNGLASTNGSPITTAEAALLWSSLLREENVDGDAFSELLRQRFEQFHGGCEPAGKIEKVEVDGRGARISLGKGGECRADTLLLGSTAACSLLDKESSKRLIRHSAPQTWRVTGFRGDLSPLLASSVILEVSAALRFAIDRSVNPPGIVISAPAVDEPLSEELLRSSMETLFPFARYSLEEGTAAQSVPEGTALSPRRALPFPGALNPIRLNSRVLIASGHLVLPRLGTAGELYVATSLVSTLLGNGGKRSRPN